MRRFFLLSVGLALLVSVGCGYALSGRGNSLPPDVVIIGVPDFVNESTTLDIDRAVTDAVLAEFAGKGSLRSQPDEVGADAVLRGILRDVRLIPTAFNSGQATRYEIVLRANVTFVNLRDNDAVLWSNPNLIFREEYDVSGEATTADPAAFFRQDTNALDRLARNFARSVVTAILEAF